MTARRPHRSRRAALALALLALAGAPAAAQPFVPVEVLAIPEAGGVPEAPTCAEALAEAARRAAAVAEAPSPEPPPAPPSEPRGAAPAAAEAEAPAAGPAPERPEVQAFANPVVTLADARAGRLPGMDPDALPLQPLEGDPAALAAVGDVLRLAQAGQPVRLSFFGASHVGGDFFTGHLRRLLQSRWGDRGHGFVWPAELYRYHRASDLNLCRTPGWRSDWVGRSGGRHDGHYGFAGASVSSGAPHDLAWLQTTRDNPQGRSFSRVELFLFEQPGGGSLVVTVDDAAPRVVPTHAPAPGLKHVRLELPDGPHRVVLRPMGDGEVRIFGVSPEREGPGVIVDSMGIRGRTARTWLSWDADERTQGIRALAPDLLVLAYGTNEAADTDYGMDRYREDLRAVVGAAREAAPGVACVLVGPSDRALVQKKGQRWAVWGRTAPVAQVQREVAREAGCAFWDWQAATGGPGSMVAWRLQPEPLAGWDLIHFTQAGYERSAERFLDALFEAAEQTGGLRF